MSSERSQSVYQPSSRSHLQNGSQQKTMANLPPLPKIEGDVDLVLDVYTHKSLRFGGAPMNEDYGDTDRLAELGARILELAVTFHFYSKKPMMSSNDIAVGWLKGSRTSSSITPYSGTKQAGDF